MIEAEKKNERTCRKLYVFFMVLRYIGCIFSFTDALRTMARREGVYACAFEGKRYDIGNKLGFLKATVEFALRREDLGAEFRAYLKEIVSKI